MYAPTATIHVPYSFRSFSYSEFSLESSLSSSSPALGDFPRATPISNSASDGSWSIFWLPGSSSVSSTDSAGCESACCASCCVSPTFMFDDGKGSSLLANEPPQTSRSFSAKKTGETPEESAPANRCRNCVNAHYEHKDSYSQIKQQKHTTTYLKSYSSFLGVLSIRGNLLQRSFQDTQGLFRSWGVFTYSIN